jgi:hypothetical protein
VPQQQRRELAEEPEPQLPVGPLPPEPQPLSGQQALPQRERALPSTPEPEQPERRLALLEAVSAT